MPCDPKYCWSIARHRSTFRPSNGTVAGHDRDGTLAGQFGPWARTRKTNESHRNPRPVALGDVRRGPPVVDAGVGVVAEPDHRPVVAVARQRCLDGREVVGRCRALREPAVDRHEYLVGRSALPAGDRAHGVVVGRRVAVGQLVAVPRVNVEVPPRRRPGVVLGAGDVPVVAVEGCGGSCEAGYPGECECAGANGSQRRSSVEGRLAYGVTIINYHDHHISLPSQSGCAESPPSRRHYSTPLPPDTGPTPVTRSACCAGTRCPQGQALGPSMPNIVTLVI